MMNTSGSLLDIDNIDNYDVLIEEFLKENYKVSGLYTIKNGVVDVKGDVKVINKKITHLTNGLFRFGEVGGGFDCSVCNLLTSLEGAPGKVSKDFDCSYCFSLKTLEGASEEVGRNFNCDCCKLLETLEGAPRKIGGDFYCGYCGKKFTKEEVTNICNVNMDILL